MGDVEGDTAAIVFDPPSQHKRFVEVDQVGIAAKGLGKDVGLEDGCRILEGHNLHEFVMSGDHGSARDTPSDHGDVLSNIFFHVFGLDILKPLEPWLIEGQGMGTDEKPEGFGFAAELSLAIVPFQWGCWIVCAMKNEEMANATLLLDHR